MQLAGVTGEGRGATDRLLAAVADRLVQDGVCLAGALRPVRADTAKCDSDLWLLPDGPIRRITQDLGTGSAACRMDAGAFETAVGLALSRLQTGKADLVVLNKFGLAEAEGRGFRTLIAEALGRDLPVLIGVSDAHRADFDRFAGGVAIALPPDEGAVLAWCRQAMTQVTEGGHVV